MFAIILPKNHKERVKFIQRFCNYLKLIMKEDNCNKKAKQQIQRVISLYELKLQSL
jgi:hypothetical protein